MIFWRDGSMTVIPHPCGRDKLDGGVEPCPSPRKSLDSTNLGLIQEGLLCGRQFGAVVATREQVTVAVCSHLHRCMSESGLHEL